jgi:tetratricopeptide (TPR) repeat protein
MIRSLKVHKPSDAALNGRRTQRTWPRLASLLCTSSLRVMMIAGGVLAVFPIWMQAQEPPPPPAPPAQPAVAAPTPRPAPSVWAVPVPAPRPPRARALGMTPPPDDPFMPDMPPMPPMPAIAPMAPMGPMTPMAMPALAPMPPMGPMTPMAMPALAPMPQMPPMPQTAPMPPTPPTPAMAGMDEDDLAPPALFAMAFEPQDEEARERARQAREMAREQVQKAREVSRAQTRRTSSEDTEYRRGAAYLDRRDYDKAIDSFNRVVDSKGDRADGALYWRAYALNRLGKRDQALASISELQKTYPQSRWIEDAKALEVEVRQNSGQPVSPDAASDDEMKIIILSNLMNSDPERTIPTLEKLLKGPSSPRVKERAIFVLAQNRSPKARDLLAQVAKGNTNPDVQLKAIEYLGVNSSSENQQLLSDVYKGSNDTHIKRAILRSFMIAHNRDALLSAARNESNAELRLEAIRQLGVMGGASELYPTESSFEGKREIIRGLMVSGDAQKLTDIAKNEKDPKLRGEAIRELGVMGRSKTGDALLAMYRTETDAGVKREIINGLYIQQNDVALVDIARKETDPAIKRELVSRLATMKSKVATDYMLEILSK